MRFTDPGWVYPVPIAADGRKASISDGFHARGDMRFRNGVGHRGHDIMYRKPRSGPAHHPWSSRWYEMIPHTPALAAGPGLVFRAGRLATGWHVIIDHGDGAGTGYHHLAEILVRKGQIVTAGLPVGIVGGSPIGYGLAHLHCDVAQDGKFFDAARLMARWRHVPLPALVDPGAVPYEQS